MEGLEFPPEMDDPFSDSDGDESFKSTDLVSRDDEADPTSTRENTAPEPRVQMNGTYDQPVDVEIYVPCSFGDLPIIGDDSESTTSTAIKSEDQKNRNERMDGEQTEPPGLMEDSDANIQAGPTSGIDLTGDFPSHRCRETDAVVNQTSAVSENGRGISSTESEDDEVQITGSRVFGPAPVIGSPPVHTTEQDTGQSLFNPKKSAKKTVPGPDMGDLISDLGSGSIDEEILLEELGAIAEANRKHHEKLSQAGHKSGASQQTKIYQETESDIEELSPINGDLELARENLQTLKRKKVNSMYDMVRFKQAKHHYDEQEHLSKQSTSRRYIEDDSDDTDGEMGNSGSETATVDERAPGWEQRRQKRRLRSSKSAIQKNTDRVAKRLADQTKQERAKEKKKPSRGKGRKVGNDLTVQSSKGKRKKTTVAKPGKTKKSLEANKILEGAQFDLGNLNSNIVADAHDSDEDATPPQDTDPSGKRKTRKDALAELLADLPEEDMRTATKTKADLDRSCHMFPNRAVRPAIIAGEWNIRGLETSLKTHQLIGSAWMLAKEKFSTPTKGGIVADEMGFGKTLQSLAVMVGNPPEKDRCGPTLVVCPAAIASQWLGEVKKHTKPEMGEVFMHRPGNRLECRDTEKTVNESFCLVTTYEEVRASAVEAMCPDELAEEHQIAEWYETEGKNRLGFLHRIPWRRIILDECTAIKGYSTMTARACHLLEGNYRWLMSGTPLINNVDELYSYLLFLRMPGWTGSREQFLSNLVDTKDSMKRMQKILSAIMLRRTHKDRLFNKRLVKLPECFRNDIRVDFSPLEKKIYEVCQSRFAILLNNELKRQHTEISRIRTSEGASGQPIIRQRHVLVLLLRLRQIATHPLLAWETIKNVLTPMDREEIKSVTTELSNGVPEYSAMNRIMRCLNEADSRARNLPIRTQSGHGGEFGRQGVDGNHFLQVISELKEADTEWDEVCSICGTIPFTADYDAVKTSCGHLYCRSCLEDYQYSQAEEGHERNRCKKCEEIYERVGKVSMWEAPADRKRRLARSRENKDLSWIKKDEPLIPSAKLLGVKAQVQKWITEDPEAKIIIYTQFLPVIKCLEKLCDDEKWEKLSYHGGMKMSDRDKSIEDFAASPQTKILLATLRSGGVGLNLTCANKIINLELWWNYAVEQQAYARIFRIGQQRETCVSRIIATDSVDERLLELQKKKSTAIQKALNDDGSMERTSIDELLELFGEVRRDEENTPYIVPQMNRDSLYMGGNRGEPLRFNH